MRTVRRSAWCVALAALNLLAYRGPAFAQESSSNTAANTSSAQTLTTIHNFKARTATCRLRRSTRPPTGTCTGQPIMAGLEAGGTSSKSARPAR